MTADLLCQTSIAVQAIASERDGARSLACAEEVPVAFRYNGFAHGVMMATPADLDDFALGFSLTEGIIDRESEVRRISAQRREGGILLELSLDGPALHRYLAGRRIRTLRGNSSCGLCGVEDLADVRRPDTRLLQAQPPPSDVILAAAGRIRSWQPLSCLTHGAHAAAWIGPGGTIRAVREDVGRHNALDKLIGAGLRGNFTATSGFCFVTSRCSFEMVQKAIAAGFGCIVSASAPTALAIRTATAARLWLCALSQGEPLVFAGEDANDGSSHGNESQTEQ